MRVEFILVPVKKREVEYKGIIKSPDIPKPPGYVGSSGFTLPNGMMVRRVVATDPAMEQIINSPGVTVLKQVDFEDYVKVSPNVNSNADINKSFRVNGL